MDERLGVNTFTLLLKRSRSEVPELTMLMFIHGIRMNEELGNPHRKPLPRTVSVTGRTHEVVVAPTSTQPDTDVTTGM